jgi:hypothetical protein
MIDTLPPGTTFVSLSSSWACTTPAVGSNGTISCFTPLFLIHGGLPGKFTSAGSFPSGPFSGFQITVAVDPSVPAGTTLTNRVTITSTTPDNVSTNNIATSAITVAAAPAGAPTLSPLILVVMAALLALLAFVRID